MTAAAGATPVIPIAVWRARITHWLCFGVALGEGFDITSMGVAAPRLGPALHLTRPQLGPVFSASIFGLFIGALVVGRLADRFGRKWTLICSIAVFALFSAATAFARGFDDLLAIRLAAGLGLGGAFPNIIAMAAEVSSERRRAMLTTIVAAGMPFGGAIASLVAAGLDWRWIFYLGGGAPALLALAMTAALAESPAFILARQAAPHSRAGFIWTLTGEGRALTTLCLWLATFCALMTLYQLLNWLPILLGEKGISKHDASVVSVAFNIGGGLGVIALATLMERLSRGFVVVAWYAGLVMALVLLALVGPQVAAASFVAFFAGAFTSSAGILLYGLAPTYYPTSIRATGVGATVAVGRLGGILGPLVAAALLTAGAGQAVVLMAMAPLAMIAGGASVVLLTRPRAA